jgi:dihydrofolate reductase
MNAIFAISKNNCIGKNGALPWNIPEDLHFFRELTVGHIVVMGKNTFESMQKPLSKRTNIVVTRQTSPDKKNLQFTKIENLPQVLVEQSPDKKVFIIGGKSLYESYIPLCNDIYVTYIDKVVTGDIFMDEGVMTYIENNYKLRQEIVKIYSMEENCSVHFCHYYR